MDNSLVVLNLGCGATVSPRAVNIDFDRNLRLRATRPMQELARRTGRDWSTARAIQFHDLRGGIPYPDRSADVVYHSHTLEHIDREHVDGFMAEIHRVLRSGGIHRIVVPDLEPHVRAIVADLDTFDAVGEMAKDHEDHIAWALEQSVRRVPGSLRNVSPLRRRIDMAAFGDARRRGQTHQWMWTRLSLRQVLERHGFADIAQVDAATSRIPDWIDYGLDTTIDGSDLHEFSLYMEAVRP